MVWDKESEKFLAGSMDQELTRSARNELLSNFSTWVRHMVRNPHRNFKIENSFYVRILDVKGQNRFGDIIGECIVSIT